ncbi:COAE1 [Auxenochlorella protothecoides x Auxenochlorella symbiontica]
MKIVGLSGGIATGKSTFAAELRTLGFPVIDSDDIAKLVVKKGRWAHRRIVKAFGSGVLTPDGEVDREKLGDIIFRDPHARRALNSATHLPILGYLLADLLSNFLRFKTVVIVDMPLLFETGFYHFTSPRLLVAAGEGMQRRRLMARDGLSEEAADVRVSSQMPLSAKRRLADIVVENDGDVEELRQSARTVGGLLQRHRWLHIWFFSPLGLGLVAAALFSLR